VNARLTGRLLACAVLTAAAVAGCGGGDDGGDVDVGPAAAAPASAPIYIEATVKPEGSAEAGARAALEKILDTSDPGAKLSSLIDQAGRDEPQGQQFTYQADIAPWLGSEIGVFFTSFEDEAKGAAVVETTDPNAALDFARKSEGVAETAPEQQHNGVAYQLGQDGDAFATLDEFLLLGDEDGVKAAIDAEQGDSLGDSDEFKDSVDDLSEESLGLLYALPSNFIDAIPQDDLDRSARSLLERAIGESGDEPVTGDVTASADDIELEISTGGEGRETPQSALIEAAPSAAWLAFGIGDLGDTAKQTVDQLREADTPGLDQVLSQLESTTGASLDELTGALGDAALYVQGVTEPTLTGALVIQSDDTQLTGRLLTQVQGLLQLGGRGGAFKELSLAGGGTGFQINDPGLAPQPVELVQQDDKLVVGYGAGSAQEALTPAQPLSTSPVFGAAEQKISSLGMDLFLSLAPVFQLAESEGATKDPDYRQAKRYIDALDYVAVGSGSEDDRASARFIIGLK
jgi:Protein of unknown function (DUF3352)